MSKQTARGALMSMATSMIDIRPSRLYSATAFGLRGHGQSRHVPAARRQIVEPNQVHLVTTAVVRDLKQVLRCAETRFLRQIVGDIRKSNRRDGVHHDVPLIHLVAPANLYMATLPNPHTALDSPTPNAFAKLLREYHWRLDQAPFM